MAKIGQRDRGEVGRGEAGVTGALAVADEGRAHRLRGAVVGAERLRLGEQLLDFFNARRLGLYVADAKADLSTKWA